MSPYSQFQQYLTRFLLVLSLSASMALNAQPLDFNLHDLNGKSLRLSDFRGRWVVINFWASWCSHCLLEMPELQEFYETSSQHAIVIGVNYGESPSVVRTFAKQLDITFPVVVSDRRQVPGFEINGLPTTFLLSPEGERVDTYLGTVSAAMLQQRLAELATGKTVH